MESLRLGIVATHPAHYHAPLYCELARSEYIDLKVFFTDRSMCEDYRNPHLGELKTDIPRFEGYDWELCQREGSGSLSSGLSAFWRVFTGSFDAVVLVGLNHPASWGCLVACQLADAVAIAKGEGDLLRERTGLLVRVKAAIRRIFGAGVDCAIFSCTSNREYFLDAGVDRDHLIFMPAAVDNEHYRRIQKDLSRPALRRDWDLRGKTVFLFVGRLTRRKRVGDLLAAWEQAKEPERPRRLVVVGDGPRRAMLESRVAGREDVVFTGTLDEHHLVRWYEAADILVVPSSWDPSPKVMNEAMNFENMCLVSDRVGSGKDLVISGENGFRYPVGDVGELRALIEKLAGRPLAELRRMGQRSRAIISGWNVRRGRRELEGHLLDHFSAS